MKNTIKKLLPESFIEYVRTVRLKKYYQSRFDMLHWDTNINLILIGTPEYCNLGDTALALSELYFLKKYFSNYNIVEITDRLYRHEQKRIKATIKKNDILFITGGGFLGSLWMDGENIVRDIIRNHPENKIIIFPQTIFFEDTQHGKNELKNTQLFWKSTSNLLVFTRENNSFQFIKNNFEKTPVYLYPDMVLSGLPVNKFKRSDTVLLCLRKDKESVLSKDVGERIVKLLSKNNINNIEYIDTIVWDGFSYENRENVMNGLLNKFSKSKLVITDKLHGMIFSIITGTPCLVFDNKTKKISGVHRWVEKLPYIKFANDNYEDKLMNLLNDKNVYEYNPKILDKEFQSMAKCINNWIYRSDDNE